MKWLSGLWGSKPTEESSPVNIQASPVTSPKAAEHVTSAVLAVEQDPRLKAAEAEARRRFSEFTSAFLAGAGSDFAVKAHLTFNGATEHIWVRVKTVQGSRISGELGNKPVNLRDMAIGSKVEIELNQVEDWMYTSGGQRQGLFTKPVLQLIEKERNGSR